MSRWLPSSLVIAIFILMFAGCKKPAESDGGDSKDPVRPSTSVSSSGSPFRTVSMSKDKPSIKEDTLGLPPPGQFLPELTAAGKSVGKLYMTIAGPEAQGGLWDQVTFTTPSGAPLHHYATIRTKQGNIKIELWPGAAPNHVRSFVALARSGYYDGLFFDRTVREEIQGQKGAFFEYLVAGCPMGQGNPNYNSIGYWLKPEFKEEIKHEEGIVGAWHEEVVETGGCKFYINMGKAPWMDGKWTVFGKVVEGMKVARTILERPLSTTDIIPDRPREPVVMEAVTIETVAGDAKK